METIEEKVNQLKREFATRIKKIEADSRFQAKPALVTINAPLALEQLSMKARLGVMKEVLESLEC